MSKSILLKPFIQKENDMSNVFVTHQEHKGIPSTTLHITTEDVDKITPGNSKAVLMYSLIRTTKRLTFDIHLQHPAFQHHGTDDNGYLHMTATNGYEVISRSRMDIQTERIWLRGGTLDEAAHRSGTMVFSSDEKAAIAEAKFHQALKEFVQWVYTARALEYYGHTNESITLADFE